MDRAVRVVEVLGFSGLISGTCSCTRMLSVADAMLSLKSTVCFCPRPAETVLFCWVSKAVCFRFHRVRAGLKLRKAKPPGVVRLHGSFQAVLNIRDGHGRARDRRPGRIGDRPDDRARRLALSQRRNPHRQSADQECQGLHQDDQIACP